MTTSTAGEPSTIHIIPDPRRVTVPPNAYVHPCATVDPTVHLAPNVWIGPDVTIRRNCEIGPGTVIGWHGFGYTDTDEGWVRKPESHGVVVEEDVHIGANVCIDRGSYRDTWIGSGTRIDNLVHVAHNVRIGQRVMVIAGAELSGSVVLEDNAWIGPEACVREHLRVGVSALVGIGAVVVKNVPAGETWVGNPAKRLEKKCCGTGCSRCKRAD